MKILYLVHQFFPRSVGGTEIYTRGLARRGQAAGHEVLVITAHENSSTNPNDFYVETTAHEEIPVVEIHANLSTMPHPARAEYSNLRIGSVVAEQIRAFKPDVVHAMHAMKLSAAALEACYELGVPVVVTLCDFWFLCPRHTLLKWDGSLCSGPNAFFKCVHCLQDLHDFAAVPHSATRVFGFARDVGAIAARPRFLQSALLKAQRIIALSSFTKAMFVQNGFPADRIEVISHGLETEDLEIEDLKVEDLKTGNLEIPEVFAPARSFQNSVLKIGFIGSLVSHKGAHLLLEAFALIPDMRVELFIYGELRENEYCRRLRQSAARDARVSLMRSFEPRALGRVLRSFDILALPALWYENQPLVVKAAQYMSVPVLASAIGSLPEMIEDGKNGWLVESSTRKSTPQVWAEHIARLASAPLPVFPSQHVKTMDENAVEMLHIYQSVLSNSTL